MSTRQTNKTQCTDGGDSRPQLVYAGFDYLSVPTLAVGEDNEVLYANPAAERFVKGAGVALAPWFGGAVEKIVGCHLQVREEGVAAAKAFDFGNAREGTRRWRIGELCVEQAVSPIPKDTGSGHCCLVSWRDVTAEEQTSREAARLHSAVDSAMTSIMMVDRNLLVTYVNQATLKMLRAHEDTLRGVFRGFSVDRLVGSCIDVFHKHPEHQRRLLDDPRNLPYSTTIQVGPLSFQLNVTANCDAQGNYVGNTLEWADVTEQSSAQKEVERLVGESVKGNLNDRADSGRFTGFMKSLTSGINTLLDTVVAPMREASRVMELVAAGDLSQLADGDFQGEFAAMRDAVNASVQSLRNVVSEIREAASAVSVGASEIASGNNDLSERTQEQAASLEETAASVEEITSTIKQNADNARQANQLAMAAREQAERGGEVVGQAVSAMSQINASSRKISDIIGVIDSIAFQTNILALNAAVEAARAGEQGRGFAVVAAEVRKLAQRSADAAKEIKLLIGESVERVNDGSRLVDASGRTLEEIVGAVKKVGDIIAEIAAASQEQAAGIDQVNKAIAQMDEATQQNAALVEEMAAASESLDDQARALIELMDTFVMDSEEHAEVPRASSPAPAPAKASSSAGARKPAPTGQAKAAAGRNAAPVRTAAPTSIGGARTTSFGGGAAKAKSHAPAGRAATPKPAAVRSGRVAAPKTAEDDSEWVDF